MRLRLFSFAGLTRLDVSSSEQQRRSVRAIRSASTASVAFHTAVCGGTTWLCRLQMVLNPSVGQTADE